MHPALLAIPAAGVALVALRVRAIMLEKKAKEKPAPPPANAPPAEQLAAQIAAAKDSLAAPVPQRVFRVGEIIGVNIFDAGISFPGMSGIVNMRIISLPVSDPRVVEAEFADQRFHVPPMKNQNGQAIGVRVPKSTITAPNPAGGLSGRQGAPTASAQPQAPEAGALQDMFNKLQGTGLQSAINPDLAIKLSPIPTRTLRQGTSGEDVKRWQTFLNARGFPVGKADGIFGPNTSDGTVAFQHANGLVPDGIAGPKTFAKAAGG